MNKETISKIVQEHISETNLVLIDVEIKPSSVIEVTIDSMDGVTIDKCIEISKHIESKLDREKEDFELTVASASISEPFRVKMQYEKNIGKEVEVYTTENRKIIGMLESVEESGFTILCEEKVAIEGKKRKEIQLTPYSFKFDEVKQVKLTFKF